jgi:hypothetical protein
MRLQRFRREAWDHRNIRDHSPGRQHHQSGRHPIQVIPAPVTAAPRCANRPLSARGDASALSGTPVTLRLSRSPPMIGGLLFSLNDWHTGGHGCVAASSSWMRMICRAWAVLGQVLDWKILSEHEREVVIGPAETAPVGICFMPVADQKTVRTVSATSLPAPGSSCRVSGSSRSARRSGHRADRRGIVDCPRRP